VLSAKLSNVTTASAPVRGAVDRIFRALADRTRLRILCLLRTGELCVGDLLSILDVPQPTASRHLAYLRKSGLVHARKNGKWVHYYLAPAKRVFHKSLLGCLDACRYELPEFDADAKRLRELRTSGGCCPLDDK
jgi:ArsR family transcriptional regulator